MNILRIILGFIPWIGMAFWMAIFFDYWEKKYEWYVPYPKWPIWIITIVHIAYSIWVTLPLFKQ